MRRYLSHMGVGDPIARQKYANRIVDGAFAPLTAVGNLNPNPDVDAVGTLT
jgi:hypothetical protein